MGTHCIVSFVNAKNVVHFESFGIEYISKEMKKIYTNQKTMTSIYIIQACDSMICEYFYIGFNDCVLKGKSLIEYTSLLSPNNYENNNKVILK